MLTGAYTYGWRRKEGKALWGSELVVCPDAHRSLQVMRREADEDDPEREEEAAEQVPSYGLHRYPGFGLLALVWT